MILRKVKKGRNAHGVFVAVSRQASSTFFRLRATSPYNYSLTVHKPAGWPLLTPFEVFEEGTLWTAMRADSGEVLGLKLRARGTVESAEVLCRVFSCERLTVDVRSELREALWSTLNLDEDMTGFYAVAEHDPLVKVLVRDLYGMRRTRRPDIFPTLILAVTLQMAPIARSNQMMNLLIKEYGDKVTFDGREILYWPSPERIARAEVEELKERCKLGYRAKVLKGIGEALVKGFPSFKELDKMPPDVARHELMKLKGIGEYSSEIVSPHGGFALDVWSAKIFSLLLLGEEAESPRSVIPRLKELANSRWGKWAGYVFFYVLHDLDNLSRAFNIDLTGL